MKEYERNDNKNKSSLGEGDEYRYIDHDNLSNHSVVDSGKLCTVDISVKAFLSLTIVP